MARYQRFTFLLDKNERAQIVTLAERLRRSQSDAVRFVVLESARQLEAQHNTPTERDAMQQAGAVNYATA